MTKQEALLRMDDQLLKIFGKWLDRQGRIGDANWKRWRKPRLAEYLSNKLTEAVVQKLLKFDARKSPDAQLTAALGPAPKDAILDSAPRAQLVDMVRKLAGRQRVDVSPSTMKKPEMIGYLKRKCSRDKISELAGLGRQARPSPVRKASKVGPTAKTPPRKRVTSKCEFDVGLSFSGEERGIAERLAALLRKAGVRVFIDSAFQDMLWGHSLHQVLEEAYQKCQFFLPILSATYRTRAYPTHELQVALSEAMERERKGYLLPLRVDDTVIPGLPKNTGYLDLRNVRLEQVVELVKKKLEKK